MCYILFSVNNEQPCPQCFKKKKKIDWDKLHPPSVVERQLTTAKSSSYKNPVPPAVKVPTQLEINLEKREKRLAKAAPKVNHNKRDLSAQYFGEYLDPNELFKFQVAEDAIRF